MILGNGLKSIMNSFNLTWIFQHTSDFNYSPLASRIAKVIALNRCCREAFISRFFYNFLKLKGSFGSN